MSDVVLLLGPIAFRNFEIPSRINFGGSQRMAVHRLPGGVRVIDALGRDDAQISFSGIFVGSNATLRARGLDELRAEGIALPLTWDVFYYTVLISSFHADYRNERWIPYRITCTVLCDEASAFAQLAPSLATAALADIGMAAVYATGTGFDVAPLKSALVVPGATVRGTSSYTSAQFDLVEAQSSMDASIGAADDELSNSDPSVATSPQDGAARLMVATDATERLSSLTSARSYLRRVAINLSNAST
jgi:hypothetical protein